MEKLKYQKDGLSRKSTTQLLTSLKNKSGKTWVEIEALLNMGTNNSTQADGGNLNGGSEPGKIIEMYRSGKRHLLTDKASFAIGLGVEEKWLTLQEYHMYAEEIFERRFSKKYMQLERKILKNMENHGEKMLKTMWQHPDIGWKEMWDAIDMVLSPMLKRLLVEQYEQQKHVREESFFSVLLGNSVINGYSQNNVKPEVKFAEFLKSI
ncbi:hypothetical protein [Methylotenera sp.]|uniref:hypothetical protein n=1 Tax=Methylotenera sp. TaxID=2051956 RepID=UPI002487523D|nr:hypothetical protein [Methylotenera sp.]MDI1363146.1 hypothetical protein [Methylotenera sp.]